MRPHRLRPRPHWALLVLLSALFVAGIGLDTAGAFEDVQVTQAIPPEMEQAQTTNVTIKGQGFDSSAKAKFLVSGTRNTGGVTVNSTTFIDGATLNANVTAAPTATVSAYDIEVQLSNGRRGKGIELFAVTVGKGGFAHSGACATYRDLATDHVTSDFKTPSATYCHPSDGQVTIGGKRGEHVADKGRFRIDTWIRDRNFRLGTLDFSSCVAGTCGIEGRLTTEVTYQSYGEYKDLGGGLVALGEAFPEVIYLNFKRIPLGETRYASLWVQFNGDSDSGGHDGCGGTVVPCDHRVSFTNETDPTSPCVGGSPVAVTCTAATIGGTCTAWTVTGTQACVSIPYGKTATDLGLYDMTFSMNIALQP